MTTPPDSSSTIVRCGPPLLVSDRLVEFHENNHARAAEAFPPMLLTHAEIFSLACAVSGVIPGVVNGNVQDSFASKADIRATREAMVLLWWKHGAVTSLLDFSNSTEIPRSSLLRIEKHFRETPQSDKSHHWPIQLFLGAESLALHLRKKSPSVVAGNHILDPLDDRRMRVIGSERFFSHYRALTGGDWFRKE